MLSPLAISGLPDWAYRLVSAAVVVLVALVVLAIVQRVFRRLAVRGTAGVEPGRARQRQTAIAVFATALRYVVLVAAGVGVAIALTGGSSLAALSGSALLVVIIGFAFQRLLNDLIAGAFILFEGQYAVGDVVYIEPSKFSGVVEELGLRTTVLRDINGDRCFIPNGQIQGVRRMPAHNRTMDVALVTRDPGLVERAVHEVTRMGTQRGARFSTPPHLTGRTELGDGLVSLRIRAAVAPPFEWMVHDLLLGYVRARAGESLVGEPRVLDGDPAIASPVQDALMGDV